MFITWWESIGHFSYGLTALSFCVRDILLLRFIAVASCAAGILFNYFQPAGPLWLPIIWLAVYIAINGYRIAGIYLERRAVSFTDEEAELYETVFRNFSKVEFMKLLRLATWRDAGEGERLAEQGADLDTLILLYNGEVSIDRDGREIGRSGDGMLIGEMSFIQGGEATATVTVTRPTRYLEWPKGALGGLMKRNPTMDVAMNSVFNIDLTRKLAGTT